MSIANQVKPEATPVSPAASLVQAQQASAASPALEPQPTVVPDRPPTILPSRGGHKDDASSKAGVEKIAEKGKDRPLAIASAQDSL